MRDAFYTLLVVWVIWKIVNGLNAMQSKKGKHQQTSSNRFGETTISYTPPGPQKKKDPDDGEYVDYEEIK